MCESSNIMTLIALSPLIIIGIGAAIAFILVIRSAIKS